MSEISGHGRALVDAALDEDVMRAPRATQAGAVQSLLAYVAALESVAESARSLVAYPTEACRIGAHKYACNYCEATRALSALDGTVKP